MSKTDPSGCAKFTRILMFISNFIIWIASLALIILGVLNLLDKPYLEALIGGNMYVSSTYIIVIVGSVAFFVSFLGCFGALKDIKCMILFHFIIVLLLFIVLLIGGILGYVFMEKAKNTIMNAMTVSMKEYVPESEETLTHAWDDTQLFMKCCGIRTPKDWALYNKHFDSTNHKVPVSCCQMGLDNKPFNCESNPTADLAYQEGCYEKASEFFKSHSHVIGGAGIGIAVLLLCGVVISLTLFRLIK